MRQISEKEITNPQKQLIHTMLRKKGISDEDYRAILRAHYEVESSIYLTRRQANDLLVLLGAKLRNPPGHAPRTKRPVKRARRSASPGNVTAMISPEQRRLIENLAKEVKWRTKDGYQRWLEGNMSLSTVASSEDARKVIEALKAMIRRQRRRD